MLYYAHSVFLGNYITNMDKFYIFVRNADIKPVGTIDNIVTKPASGFRSVFSRPHLEPATSVSRNKDHEDHRHYAFAVFSEDSRRLCFLHTPI